MPHNVAIYYTPDAVIGERAIVGIATCDYGNNTCRVAFVGPEKIERIGKFFNRDFADILQVHIDDFPNWDAKWVLNHHRTDYPTSIFFSEPMASIQPFDECFESAVKRYLGENR